MVALYASLSRCVCVCARAQTSPKSELCTYCINASWSVQRCGPDVWLSQAGSGLRAAYWGTLLYSMDTRHCCDERCISFTMALQGQSISYSATVWDTVVEYVFSSKSVRKSEFFLFINLSITSTVVLLQCHSQGQLRCIHESLIRLSPSIMQLATYHHLLVWNSTALLLCVADDHTSTEI